MVYHRGCSWGILLSLWALLQICPQAVSGVSLPSIVSPEEQVSDFAARLALARLLASFDGEVGRAVKEYRFLLKERPRDPQIRLELAKLLIREKNYQEAIQELQTVLQQRPGDSQAAVALARIYLWTKNYPEAIRLFEDLQRRRTLAADQLGDLARAYTWNRQYPQAIAAYEGVLRKLPQPQAKLYMELGDVHLYNKNLTAAVSNYRKALELEPAADALRKKLALTLSWNKLDEEALALLLPLQKKLPADQEIALELVRVYAKLGRQDQAVALARMLLQRFPADAHLLVELGDLELGLGHAQAARDLYDKALRLADRPEKLALHVADQMNFWGDFYRVEASYREYLRRHPDDVKVWQKLAWALVSAQRFEEAEGIYRRLRLEQPMLQDPWLGLVKLRLAENDLKGALRSAREFLEVHPDHPEGLNLKGEALLRLQRYPEALKTFRHLSLIRGCQVPGLLGTGKVLIKQKLQAEAAAVFNQVLMLDPQNAEARYYQTSKIKVKPGEVSEPPAGQESPMQLARRAQLLAADGFNRQAIDTYQAAMDRDPQCFPARLGLAEILGVDHQYDRSLELYRALAADFPGDSKILISWARVLAWSKHYHQSIEVYERAHKLNPADPVPPREMARTAAWGKMMPKARRIYASLWEKPVDRQLLAALEALQAQRASPGLQSLVQQLRDTPNDSIYQGYEKVSRKPAKLSHSLTPETQAQLEQVLVELLPAYKVQKAAYLESRAKWLAWNKRLTTALDTYQELVEAEPGNQEALFDQAQAECALGLCEQEAETYRDLLLIDPLHNLAGMALERVEISRHSSLRLGHTYWEETGSGEHAVSQIARHQTGLTLDYPLTCAHHLRLSALRWLDRPKDGGGAYWADGFSLELKGLLNPYIRYGLMWTHKYYEKGSVADLDSGHARVWFNLRNYAELDLGYERTNEIYNNFCIRQGTQADQVWVGLSSWLTRKLEVQSQARYINYSDNNDSKVFSLSGGYDVTDHPRTLRLKLRGEYRDSNKINRYIYRGETLVNIIYPYWTPKNYLGGAMGLEWRHDLSKFFFCGSELHYYGLRAFLLSDSKGNTGYALEAEWNYEFYKRWTINLKGLLQRSDQWDANAIWAYVQYKF